MVSKIHPVAFFLFLFSICHYWNNLTSSLCEVYWNCQFIARVSNMSLRHWQQMGGVNINEGIVIDKSIHRSINARSSVLKVPSYYSQVISYCLYCLFLSDGFFCCRGMWLILQSRGQYWSCVGDCFPSSYQSFGCSWLGTLLPQCPGLLWLCSIFL